MQTPAYQLSNIKKYYNRHPAVDIKELTLVAGSITGVVGPNGSGKSTLLSMLAFVNSPSEGTILYKGQKAHPFSEAVRFRVSLLPQEPFLLKRTVFENIVYGLKLRGFNKSQYLKKVNDALMLVGLSPVGFSGRKWYQLSGGEAHRVALAARLALKPEVLILDEPTAGVDAASAQQIMDSAFMASKEWGTTLIIAGHDWKWLHEICDNVIQMFKGKIVGKGLENIIFGPWNQVSTGLYEKLLDDGQRILVKGDSPLPTCAAIIPHTNIAISSKPPGRKPAEHLLKGVLFQLSFEPGINAVMAFIRAGGQAFTLRIPLDKAKENNYYPGQSIYITYPISSVVWY
ncbi:MAG: energy-coupling factor ABC transporter ATP-binding protein [Proteobacteria bacterium]|nr:energy-coupling factor ABC transporter ATP-binding protein [Pseudomonadota bacterium]